MCAVSNGFLHGGPRQQENPNACRHRDQDGSETEAGAEPRPYNPRRTRSRLLARHIISAIRGLVRCSGDDRPIQAFGGAVDYALSRDLGQGAVLLRRLVGDFRTLRLDGSLRKQCGFECLPKRWDAGRICQYLQRPPGAEQLIAYPARPFFIPRNNAIREVDSGVISREEGWHLACAPRSSVAIRLHRVKHHPCWGQTLKAAIGQPDPAHQALAIIAVGTVLRRKCKRRSATAT